MARGLPTRRRVEPFRGDVRIDIVIGTETGPHLVESEWAEPARASDFPGIPVPVASPQDPTIHHLFVPDRRRSAMADIVHLVLPHADGAPDIPSTGASA